MSKRRRKKNSLLKNIMIVILPVILCVGGYYVYKNFIQEPGIPSVNKLIKEKKKMGFADKDDNKIDISNYVNHLPEYRDQYGNYDIVAKLEIPNLNIDALITRTDNNEYYLNYSLYRQWDGLGVPFIDYRNTDLVNAKQINIYGHNTQRQEFYDQLPFTNLEAYVDQEIFNNYKDIYLSIDEKQMHYEVVAIKILKDGNPEHTKVEFTSNGDYLKHINLLLDGSLYRGENAIFLASDRILVLQVCHYDPMGSYLLVIAKEKKE